MENYVDFFGGMPLPKQLSDDEINELIFKSNQGSTDARNKIITHNIRLVIHIVNKYKNIDFDIEDLISIGSMGLIKAVETFNSSKGYKFSTYAAVCIENEVKMFLRKLPRYLNIESLDRNLAIDNEYYEIKLTDILSDEDDFILDIEIEELNGCLIKLIDNLPESDRQIVMLYFGFYDDKEYTQYEISKKFNVTQKCISLRLNRILKKLKEKKDDENNTEKNRNQTKDKNQ